LDKNREGPGKRERVEEVEEKPVEATGLSALIVREVALVGNGSQSPKALLGPVSVALSVNPQVKAL
jgi:hypothetical protein